MRNPWKGREALGGVWTFLFTFVVGKLFLAANCLLSVYII